MPLLLVAVSGTVGKQTLATDGSAPAILRGFYLTPSAANATIKIREGNASGTVRFFGRATSAFGTKDFIIGENGHKFLNGMHVKVIGTLAEAYLILE